jgi:hypothetical protein
MARVLEARKPGGLSAKMEKPAMKLRSDLPASGFQSVGGAGGIRQDRPGAHGGTIYEDEADDYEGDWGDF